MTESFFAASSEATASQGQEALVSDLGLKDDGPTQPHLTSYPKTDLGSQKRSFNSTYFKSFPFLEYSIQRDAIYCFACRHFTTTNADQALKFKTMNKNANGQGLSITLY